MLCWVHHSFYPSIYTDGHLTYFQGFAISTVLLRVSPGVQRQEIPLGIYLGGKCLWKKAYEYLTLGENVKQFPKVILLITNCPAQQTDRKSCGAPCSPHLHWFPGDEHLFKCSSAREPFPSRKAGRGPFLKGPYSLPLSGDKTAWWHAMQ